MWVNIRKNQDTKDGSRECHTKIKPLAVPDFRARTRSLVERPGNVSHVTYRSDFLTAPF